VRRTLLEAYEHQNLPYSEIMEAINGRGDSLHHDPILSVIFNFDEPGELAHPADVNISWCPTVAGYTAFGLTCNVTVSENAYFVELLFPSDRVSEDLAKSLGDSFIKTISEVGALGVAGVRQTDIASATDIERQYLNFENGSASPVPISVVSGIESALKIHSDRVAIVANDDTRTFKKLDDQSARIAKYLAGATLLPGSCVIVCAEHSSDVIAAMLGVLRAGFVLVPVDPALPDDRKSWIQKDCQAKIVLTDSDSHFPGFVVDSSGVVQNIAECNTHENDSLEVRVSEIQGTDPAYILYTSGSTGLPKGVVISHSAFANYVSWAAQFYELSRGSGAIFHGSISFDATLTSIFPPLIAGQRILIPQSSQDPIAGVVGLLREGAEISLLKVTPAHLELLNAALGYEVPDQAVRVLVIGGEALKASAVSPWLEPNCTTRVINEYGPTETVVGCCVYEIPRIKLIESSLPIGRPIPNTGLRVVDSSGRMLPTGVAGELFIYGSGVGIKYLNQDDLTERKFKMLPANPHSRCDKETVRGYFSGDRVRWSDQGELHYLGRTDGQILLRGFRIEPEEIENALNQLTGISQSGVVVQKHDEGDSRLVAFVAMESETAMDSDEIRRQLATLVPGYMVPASFLRVKNLPLTSTGKINRSALGEIEADIIQTSATMEGATDSIEVEASRIWKELLKVDLIPLDANFFDLGGHSILAVKLIDGLNHYFSCDLKPIDIYQSPTVRLISGLIREGKNDSVDKQIPERMSRRGDVSRSKRNRAFNSKASAR
jgi:amino acid adenylation domain-containing protein